MLSKEEIIYLEKEDKAIQDYYAQKRKSKVFLELSERQKMQCTYLCRIAKNSFFISFDGILNGCVRSRRKGFDLKKCKIMNYCDFCPGEFEIETGNPTIAPKQICELAQMRYQIFG